MKINEIIVRTLPDNITDKDELGSHQKIADSIAQLINSEAEGKCIALTGTWGSGKSSVIEMLKQNFDTTTAVFVFDAWAHERDPLRRSFLENLIDFLNSQKWIKENNYADLKERLAKRQESTNVKYFLKPTFLGYLATFATFCVPFGIIILSQNDDGKLASCPTWVGITLTFLPIIVSIGFYLLSCLWFIKDKMKYRSFIFNDLSRNFESKTFKTPDPTTIEFHEAYRKILEEAMIKKDRKLVLVVDNLDRLDCNNALAMWATMRTFLDFSPFSHEYWAKNLWLIIPFDPKALTRLWKSDAENTIAQNDLAGSFIDKTFQLSFHVPEPVLSNWIDYFKAKLRWAFQGISDEDVHTIYRIFRLGKFRGSVIPTPREIKIFINKLGTIYRIWGKEIPLSDIALYVSLERDGKIEIYKLQNSKEPLIEPTLAELIGEDYRESLAAIYFNVPKNQALHVLLAPKLENILQNRNRSAFKELTSDYGFNKVLEDIVEANHREWANESPSTIAWLAECLEVPQTTVERSLCHTWDLLIGSIYHIQSFGILNEETGNGISKLVDYKKQGHISKLVLAKLSKTELSFETGNEVANKFIISNWLKGCLNVLEKIKALSGPDLIFDTYSCPGSADTYYDILLAADELAVPVEFIEFLKPSAGYLDVISIFSGIILKGNYDGTDQRLVKMLKHIEVEWPWDSFIDSLRNRLRAPQISETNELNSLLGTLIEFTNDYETATTSINTIATNGDCFHYLSEAISKKNPFSTALCLYVILKYNPAASLLAHVASSPAGVKLFNTCKSNLAQIEFAINDLALLIKSNKDTDILFNGLSKDTSLEILYYRIIQEICKSDDFINIVGSDEIINNENVFYNALAPVDQYQSVVNTCIEKAELIDKIKIRPFSIKLASLYGAILKSGLIPIDSISDWIVSGLRGLSKDDWTSEFDAEYESIFNLIEILTEANKIISLNWLFREALDEYKLLVLSRNEPKAMLSRNWGSLVSALDENLKKTYIDQILEEIIDSDNDCGQVIALFGDLILDCERLKPKSNEIIRKGFYSFYKREGLSELKWFLEILKKCPGFFENANYEIRESLKNFIETRGNDLSEEMSSLLSEVGELIGVVDKPKVSEKNEDLVD